MGRVWEPSVCRTPPRLVYYQYVNWSDSPCNLISMATYVREAILRHPHYSCHSEHLEGSDRKWITKAITALRVFAAVDRVLSMLFTRKFWMNQVGGLGLEVVWADSENVGRVCQVCNAYQQGNKPSHTHEKWIDHSPGRKL